VSVAELEAREVQLEAPPSGLWRDAWHRLRRNPAALVGFFLVGLFIFVAIFAPLIAPEDPAGKGIASPLSRLEGSCCPGPSADHLFGIDQQGRDEFSRVVYGARYSLLIGIVSVAVGLSMGLLLGAVAGYFGGTVDSVIMRLVDIMLAVPGLLLAIGVVAALGPGLTEIMIAVGVTQIPIFARLLRGSVLAVKENDFVLAARAVGVPRRSILVGHIVPNSLSPVLVQGTLAMATAIIDVAGLGFLGLGPPDPATAEWGTMLTDTTRYLQTAPHLALIPGAAIIVAVLGFNLIGDGLREALDPRFRGRA
jgi:peptide/nickel transport system permease protein